MKQHNIPGWYSENDVRTSQTGTVLCLGVLLSFMLPRLFFLCSFCQPYILCFSLLPNIASIFQPFFCVTSLIHISSVSPVSQHTLYFTAPRLSQAQRKWDCSRCCQHVFVTLDIFSTHPNALNLYWFNCFKQKQNSYSQVREITGMIVKRLHLWGTPAEMCTLLTNV